jgi:hypothetical protein
MIRCDGFGRSALFAAGAAAGWLAWAVAAGPVVGVWRALVLYLVATTALYVAALPHRARRVVIVLGVAIVALSVAACAGTTAGLAIALAAIVGLARSAFFYRAAPARAVLTELLLLVGGLLFARSLAGPSVPSIALALWGFLLVQSLFFLIPGARARSAAQHHPDPFDEAHRRTEALLEEVHAP